MDNINIILSENLQKFRKEKGMTQEELATELGVTYQAISKWENAKSAPDIFFLPQLADIFGCSIDLLFSRERVSGSTYRYDSVCSALPWKDDDVIRGVVCHGQRILSAKEDLTDRFTFEIVGDTKKVESKCNITVNGSVNGGCNAGNSINVSGSVTGGMNCGANVSVGGGHTGGLNCGANVSCGGDIEGGINCGAGIACHNIRAKGINCGSAISAGGDIRTDMLKMRKGEIRCNNFRCETIKGSVKVHTKE